MSEPDLFTAVEKKRAAQESTASKHRADIERLAPLMRELALKSLRAGVTIGDLRCYLLKTNILPVKGKGRELSWLCAVPRAAGLLPTDRRRMCDLPDSRNDHRVWLHPDFV